MGNANAPPLSYTICTEDFFPGDTKTGTLHSSSLLSSARGEEIVELYLHKKATTYSTMQCPSFGAFLGYKFEEVFLHSTAMHPNLKRCKKLIKDHKMTAWAFTASTCQASLLLLLSIFEKKILFIHPCIILKSTTPCHSLYNLLHNLWHD